MTPSLQAAGMLRRALARRTEEVQSGELNIVPFLDVVTNLLLFLLATSSVVLAVSELDVSLSGLAPRTSRGGREPRTASMTLTQNGVVIAGPGGFMEPGCEAASRAYAIAVPRRGEAHDWGELSRCMARLHAATGDEQIILSAEPDVPYEHILAAMDAAREHDGATQFADVIISVGVR